MSSVSRIDPKALDLLRSLEADSPGSLRELVRLFINDAPGQLLRIEEGCRNGDSQTVRQSSHFIRSGAMALGLTDTANASYAVERMPVEDYGIAGGQAQVAQLRSELAEARVVLLDMINEG